MTKTNIPRQRRICLPNVLVSLGCYNKIPYNRSLFLTVLEAGESKIKVLVHSVPGENSLPGLHMAIFFLCSQMVKRKAADSVGGGLSCVCSYKGTNLTMRAPLA